MGFIKKAWNWLTGNSALDFEDYNIQDRDEKMREGWEKFFNELNIEWFKYFNEDGPFDINMETLDFYKHYKVLVERKVEEKNGPKTEIVLTPEVAANTAAPEVVETPDEAIQIDPVEQEVLTPEVRKYVRKTKVKDVVKTEE